MNHKTSEENKITIANFHCSEHGDIKPLIVPKCPKCHQDHPLSTVLEEQERLFDEKFHDDEVGQESTPAIVMGTDIAFCKDVKDFLTKSNRTVIEKVIEIAEGMKWMGRKPFNPYPKKEPILELLDNE